MIIENSFSILPQPCQRVPISLSENQSDRTGNRQNNKRQHILDDELRDNGKNNKLKSVNLVHDKNHLHQ